MVIAIRESPRVTINLLSSYSPVRYLVPSSMTHHCSLITPSLSIHFKRWLHCKSFPLVYNSLLASFSDINQKLLDHSTSSPHTKSSPGRVIIVFSFKLSEFIIETSCCLPLIFTEWYDSVLINFLSIIRDSLFITADLLLSPLRPTLRSYASHTLNCPPPWQTVISTGYI